MCIVCVSEEFPGILLIERLNIRSQISVSRFLRLWPSSITFMVLKDMNIFLDKLPLKIAREAGEAK